MGGYSVYKDIKGEEIRWFGDFFEYFPLTFLLLLYLTGLAFKRLEIDKKDKSNREASTSNPTKTSLIGG